MIFMNSNEVKIFIIAFLMVIDVSVNALSAVFRFCCCQVLLLCCNLFKYEIVFFLVRPGV